MGNNRSGVVGALVTVGLVVLVVAGVYQLNKPTNPTAGYASNLVMNTSHLMYK
jgi:hypothetical protein